MRGEQGAVLVVVALLIPVLVLLATLTVDTANFFVHKRVMQIKADAAALAGAGDLAEQIEAGAGCDTSTVYEAARAYAKERNDADGLGEGTEVRVANPELTSSPCTDAAVDITVRENDVPWIFQITSTVEEIHARARVELQTIGTQSGVAPIGIPLPPDDAAVLLNGTEYEMVPLDGLDDEGRKLFQVTVPDYLLTAATDVDVRFGAGNVIEDVGYIRGWDMPDASGDTDAPELGAVDLVASETSCLDDPGPTPHFFSSEETCAVDIEAQIDWTISDEDLGPETARVYAEVAGRRSPYELDHIGGRWVSADAELLIPAGAGPADITLRWEQYRGKVGRRECKTNNPCDGDFGTVARPYSADPDSIGLFQIGGSDDAGVGYTFGLHSAPRGSTPTLTFTVGLKSNLAVNTADARTLRVRDDGTNLTGGITCEGVEDDPNRWSFLFVAGCQESFQVNEGNDDCAIERTPRDCLTPRPGNAPDIDPGLTERVAPEGTCSPYDYPGEDDDPRLIAVALTDFGAFERDNTPGAPQDIPEIPVRGFAWFYVSGWTNNVSQVNACSNAADVPDNPGDREIYGRYVTRIDQTSPGQIGNGEQCNLNDVYGCVAVMTH